MMQLRGVQVRSALATGQKLKRITTAQPKAAPTSGHYEACYFRKPSLFHFS